MALEKQLVEIPAADGLAQKIDPRRLPPGKAAKALNLVKNKQGALEKRLGFQPLTVTDPFSSGYSFSTGINLGTWNQNLFAVGRGTWNDTGAKVTCLSQYSDDLPGLVRKGQLPDLKVSIDKVLVDTPNAAINITSAISGDYCVVAWVDLNDANALPLQSGYVFTAAFELSTGNVIQPPTQMYSGINGKTTYVRLIAVGSTFVLCYNNGSAPANIYCQTLTTTALSTGTGWVPGNGNNGAIVTNLTTVNVITTPSTTAALGCFDLRAATGGADTDFLLAYETTGNAAIVCQRRQAASPSTVDATFVVNPSPNGSISISAIAIRADLVTGRCAVAYCQTTDTNYPAASAPVIRAAVCTYPSMAFENGSSTNDTLIYTAPSSGGSIESPAVWMDIVQCGSGGQLPGLCWTIAHSPFGSTWCGQDEGFGEYQFNTNRVTTHTPTTIRSAKIVTNQFEDGANSLTPLSNTSGSHAGLTPGVILASRGLEANGIAYFLGWIPSNTQGGYVALAYDQMANPTQHGDGYPMRPVAWLQSRSAQSEPGAGYLYGRTPNGAYIPVGPNAWSGGSEWQLPTVSDGYATSYVSYFGSTQGSRMQPAYGALQTLPLTGYNSSQWGTLTGIAAGTPMCYDGVSVFEQNFAYAPESALCVLGSSGASHGPQWTNANDHYTWIFTWEQFDAAGNLHISARSTPVTVDGSASQANVSGTPKKYAPTFYVPTLGTTYRGQFGSAPSLHTFSNSLPSPNYPVTLGVYRTQLNGSLFFRVADRFFNNADPVTGGFTANTFSSGVVSYVDFADDLIASPSASGDVIDDGTHPLLYGDGSTGAPGNLDEFSPPASDIQVRHKERLFIANGNVVYFTKQRGELKGPGYNPQVNFFSVGDATPIIQMESMDDKLIVYKANALYYVSGDGPADDGSGSSFSSPQPIPTDAGCSDPYSVKATPEGQYFMSTAGLRLLTRNLGVEYVGGPVEDELGTYPDIRATVLYPGQNRVVFAATNGDGAGSNGEMLWRDYVLDAWTTAQVLDSATLQNAVALAVANAPRLANAPGSTAPVLHFMTSGGRIWRERDPLSANPYFDNTTYVSSTWVSPIIHQQDNSRFRLWDLIVFGQSQDPHGLVVNVSIDNNLVGLGTAYTWAWSGIAPGGTTPTGLTRIRNYDGRFGAAFQVQIQDVTDPSTVSGQGFKLLGLSLGLGVAPGLYKLVPSNTQ